VVPTPHPARRLFNELLHETITVGAPGSAFDLGTVLGQQKVSGAKLAEAAEKRLQQRKATTSD